MEYSYYPSGVCSIKMTFTINDNIVDDLKIIGGCQGNTQGISKLVKGKSVDELIELLQGIDCGGRGTSCPDQIAQCLIDYKQNHI